MYSILCSLATVEVWQWSETLLSTDHAANHRFNTIFMAEDLQHQAPSKAWTILRRVLCWGIWKAGNEHHLDTRLWVTQAVIGKMWYRFQLYSR